MDAELDAKTGDYTSHQINTLANAVYIRLMTPLGTWWQDTTLGSRLHELEREKDVQRVQIVAKQYAEEALVSLLKEKRAKHIVVSAEIPVDGQCTLYINVEDATGRPYTFSHTMRVS